MTEGSHFLVLSIFFAVTDQFGAHPVGQQMVLGDLDVGRNQVRIVCVVFAFGTLLLAVV